MSISSYYRFRKHEKRWGETSIMAEYGLYGAMVRHSLSTSAQVSHKRRGCINKKEQNSNSNLNQN